MKTFVYISLGSTPRGAVAEPYGNSISEIINLRSHQQS